jgi:hypothetical protein
MYVYRPFTAITWVRIPSGTPIFTGFCTVQDGRVTGVQTPTRHYPADAVICTTPTPYVSALVPDLPRLGRNDLKRYTTSALSVSSSSSVSPHFWVNVSETDITIPGIERLDSNHRGRFYPFRWRTSAAGRVGGSDDN